ncbi:MAG: hypothetical protein NT154_38095 [Verrucomicrobia bacterium]|nr:hypothetical protein [Verrucomicrobiota bacterium]
MTPKTEQPQSQPVSSPAMPARSNEGKLLIVGLRTGRLGNRLALFANLIAFAEEYGHHLINFAFHSYAALFESTRRDVFCRYPAISGPSCLDIVPGVGGAIRNTRIFYHMVRGLSRLNEDWHIFGKKAVTLREGRGQMIIHLETPEMQARIAEAKVVFVYGFIFRAPAAMRKHAKKIRAYFRPIEAYEQASSQAVAPLRTKGEVVVGVHIRHADQRTWQGGKYYFATSRYAQWMNEMKGQFPGQNVSFLVCSDEPRHRDEFPGLSVGFGPGSSLGDMYALAKCDFVLGSVSSYSQWASFYGDKPLYQLRTTNDQLELSKFSVSYLDDIPR